MHYLQEKQETRIKKQESRIKTREERREKRKKIKTPNSKHQIPNSKLPFIVLQSHPENPKPYRRNTLRLSH
jgi:hypothetical protein